MYVYIQYRCYYLPVFSINSYTLNIGNLFYLPYSNITIYCIYLFVVLVLYYYLRGVVTPVISDNKPYYHNYTYI